MKTPARLLLALAATCVGLARPVCAQVITNTDTYAGYSSSAITFSSFGNTLYQTFGNVSAVHSMTFNFFATSTPSAASEFTATIGQWNGSALIGATSVSLGNFTVPATGDWSTATIGSFSGLTYQKSFDLTSILDPLVHPTFGYLTNSANTYAMVISQTSGPNTIALGANFTNPLQTSLTGFDGATNLGTTDWVFSQMSVYAGSQTLVPIPESSTVAAIAGAVLVAGLVIVRTRQRRQAASADPAAA